MEEGERSGHILAVCLMATQTPVISLKWFWQKINLEIQNSFGEDLQQLHSMRLCNGQRGEMRRAPNSLFKNSSLPTAPHVTQGVARSPLAVIPSGKQMPLLYCKHRPRCWAAFLVVTKVSREHHTLWDNFQHPFSINRFYCLNCFSISWSHRKERKLIGAGSQIVS